MKILNIITLLTMFFVSLTAETTADATVTCADDQVLFRGKCKDAKNCKTQLGFFKQTMANGKKHIARRPQLALTLVDGNLKLALSFANAADFQTSAETGLATTCIQVSLKRFGAAFTNQVDDTTTITSSLDNTTRTWSFTIEKSQFDTVLLKDETNDNIIYTGFYAVVVNLLLPNDNGLKPLAFFGFKFSAFLSKDLATLVKFEITPKVQAEQICADDAGTQCVNTAKSTLSLFSDDTCTTPFNGTQLVVGEKFYVKQTIAEDGFKGGKWKPMDANITVVADGVTKNVKPKILDKGEKGEQCYEVKINFLANNAVIASEAQMTDTTTTSTRLLQEAEADDAYVVGTASASCVKASADASCPTQAEVKVYNTENCDSVSCDEDSSSNGQIIISLVIMAIGLIL